jgi:hypothetical protein
MLIKLSDYFYNNLKPKTLFVAVIAQLIFGFFILPQAAHFIDPFDKNVVLDLRFGFSVEKAYQVLSSYSASGRNIYLFTEIIIDTLYIAVYTVAFSFLLSLFFQKSFSNNHYFHRFNIFPFLLGISDLVENFGIVAMLIKFPEKLIWAAKLASAASLTKWSCTLFNLLLLFTGIIAWGLLSLVRKMR